MAEVILALVLALIIAGVFTYGLGRPAPWGGFLWLLLVIFLVGWAVALWAQPVGPVVWGAAWVPVLFAGLIVALLIATLAAPTPRLRTPSASEEEAVAAAGIGLLFWILLALLFVAIAFGYWW